MKYVEVVADAGSAATLAALAQKVKAVDFRLGIVGDDGMQVTRLVVDEDYLQSTLDTLQNVLGAQPTARILVLDVEASLPKTEEENTTRNRRPPCVRCCTKMLRETHVLITTTWCS